MAPAVKLNDGLQSTVAQLGTMRDKATTVEYVDNEITDQELTVVYRTSWLARKIVDIPALDSFREWRAWQGEQDEIENLEEEEKRLDLQTKCLRAYKLARLFGECFLYFDLGDKPDTPVVAERVKLGGVRFVTLLTHRQLSAGEIEQDPLSDKFGEPKWYDVIGTNAAGTVRIHPDRVVSLRGPEQPDDHQYGALGGRRGDSVLYALLNSVKQFDSTTANIASLVFEAKIDVIAVKGLMDNIAGNPYEERKLLERYRLASVAKGNNGMLLLDADNETYEQKELTFGSLPDIMDRFAMNAAGAADIPATRLFGRSPAGMNATGESDLRNYYDRIKAQQELELRPALRMLDECLIYSALGERPAELHYIWTSLWQNTDEQRQALGKATVEIIKGIKDVALLPDEVLADVLVNMMTQDGVIPGLESMYADFIAAGGLTPAEEMAAAEDDYYESEVPSDEEEEETFSDGLILDAKKRQGKGGPGTGKFDESKHKRGPGGKFASKGGTADAGVAQAMKASAGAAKFSKKYPKEKVAELAQKKPSELTFYEKKMVAKFKKAEKESAAVPTAVPTAATDPASSKPSTYPGFQKANENVKPTAPDDMQDFVGFGVISPSKAAKDLENHYGLKAEQFDKATVDDFAKMGDTEIMAGAEYAYSKGDVDMLAKIYQVNSDAIFNTVPSNMGFKMSTKLEAMIDAPPLKVSLKPPGPDAKPMTPKEAFIAKAEADAGVLAQGQAAKVAKAQATVTALEKSNSQGTAAYYNAKLELAAAKGDTLAQTKLTQAQPVKDPFAAGSNPAFVAAASGPSAKQKALDTVATKQYPASKVEALLTKNPKDLSFYEKKKLSAYKKALQAQKDDIAITSFQAQKSGDISGPASTPITPDDYEVDPYSLGAQQGFTTIGQQNYGMKAATIQKLVTGEWKPDPSKPYQQKALDEAKDFLVSGVVKKPAVAVAAPKTPFTGSPSGSVYKGLQDSPPPITSPSSPQSSFAGYDALTGSETMAVKSYTGSGYTSINGALRGKNQAGPETTAKIARIDAAIDKSLAKTDLVVVRGISNNALTQMQKTAGTAALAPGGVIKDLGYISTTRNASVASNFSSGVGLKIEVPKGSKILPVKNISNHSSEDEFILPRGSSFEIIKLDEVNNVLHVRLLAA